jgi:nucleotide-binding universal stress UspA family protein
MSIFDYILFPTDGSEQSKKALESLVELAKKFNSKVFILNTFEVPVPITNYELSSDLYLSVEGVLSKNSKDILEEVKEVLEKEGINAQYISIAGDSGSIIIERAEKLEASMILMGSRGLGAIKSVLMGSVSNYVLHHSKCPVMIIH